MPTGCEIRFPLGRGSDVDKQTGTRCAKTLQHRADSPSPLKWGVPSARVLWIAQTRLEREIELAVNHYYYWRGNFVVNLPADATQKLAIHNFWCDSFARNRLFSRGMSGKVNGIG